MFDDPHRPILGVRAARLALGWGQIRLSVEANIPQERISRIELGRTTPTDDELLRLARALGLNTSELLAPIRYGSAAECAQ